MGIAQLLKNVKAVSEDFEWYPSTEEILSCVKSDIESKYRDSYSILDVGAGDGRVLEFLGHKNGRKYAIEKSKPLIRSLPADVFIVGTEFKEQTLMDKKCNVLYCNPPYSEFELFATKILTETLAGDVYLVLPKLWSKSTSISQAIERRSGKVKVIGSFDFLNADRQARCDVDVVHVQYTREGWSRQYLTVDPFSAWFKDNFDIHIGATPGKATNLNSESVKTKTQNALVTGRDLVSTLVELYNAEMDNLISTFKGLERVDGAILAELNVSLDGIYEALNQRIEGLKNLFWKELFDNFTPVTSKLTHKSRTAMLETLSSHTSVDFTAGNAYAVVEWVVKNANQYFDTQLVEVYENLICESSVNLYKSNERVFTHQEWSYNQRPRGLDRFSLDRRIVTYVYSTFGGYHYESRSGLRTSAANRIDDLATLAHNLGFDTKNQERSDTCGEWTPSKMKTFHYYDHTVEKRVPLFTVRAYKNGNIHLKLNEAFIAKLNVEYGRLKGWINSPKEAADEIDGVSVEVAEQSFNTNLRLEPGKTMSALGCTSSS